MKREEAEEKRQHLKARATSPPAPATIFCDQCPSLFRARIRLISYKRAFHPSWTNQGVIWSSETRSCQRRRQRIRPSLHCWSLLRCASWCGNKTRNIWLFSFGLPIFCPVLCTWYALDNAAFIKTCRPNVIELMFPIQLRWAWIFFILSSIAFLA